MSAQEKKMGVYLCGGCGIAEAAPLAGLEKVAVREFKAPLCRQHDYLCGEDGLKMIRDDVEAGTVNQAVIAACSPRVNADKFRFDGVQIIRANLREQVAWTQPPGAEDTEMMAADYVRMAITEARKVKMPEPYTEGPFSERILVVGGGVSGMTAALEAAHTGYDVLLLEQSDRLGGHALELSKRVPERPPYRTPQENNVESLIAAVKAEKRIDVRFDARVVKTSGMPGKFTVEVKQASATCEETVGAIVLAAGWRPYDASKLGHLGYGASPDVVTSQTMEEMLKAGAVKRKSDGAPARIVAFVQCAGSRDPEHLPYCSSVCCSASIRQAIQLREADPDTSVYIIYDELRTPGVAEEFYRTAQSLGVIFIKGKVKSVGADLTVTVEDALLQQEVPMSGLDMVVLATGMVPNATLDIQGEEPVPLPDQDINPLSPIPVAGYCNGEKPAANGCGQPPVTYKGAPILNLQYRQGPHLPVLADGFADSHFICFPYETRRTGIYACGPVRRPMDWAEAAEDATGAALKAIQAIRNVSQGAALHPRAGDLSFPRINLNACTKCRRCTVECPFGAIDETPEGYPILNPTRCRRCGTCMGACPVRTISFDNYSVEMLTSMIKAVEVPEEDEEKPRVLVLACQNDAYPALDMAGIQRSAISPYIRVLPVRCLGSVSMLCINDALSTGYDGVMLMGCKSGDDYQCHFVRGSAMAQERMLKVGDTLKSMMLEKERVTTLEISITDASRMPDIIGSYMETIDGIGPNPFKGM